jgi:hypothetical protein
MKIDKVTATIRYSKEIGGSWKSVEIGAEGTVDVREDWKEAQLQLYADLTQQLVSCWNNGKSQESPQAAQKANQKPSLNEPPSHFCEEHNVPFKSRNGPHGEFYSHQIKGSKDWCNESKK